MNIQSGMLHYLLLEGQISQDKTLLDGHVEYVVVRNCHYVVLCRPCGIYELVFENLVLTTYEPISTTFS